jgi:hypothetical protein
VHATQRTSARRGRWQVSFPLEHVPTLADIDEGGQYAAPQLAAPPFGAAEPSRTLQQLKTQNGDAWRRQHQRQRQQQDEATNAGRREDIVGIEFDAKAFGAQTFASTSRAAGGVMTTLNDNFYPNNSNLSQPPPLPYANDYQCPPALQAQEPDPFDNIDVYDIGSYLNDADFQQHNIADFAPVAVNTGLNDQEIGRQSSQGYIPPYPSHDGADPNINHDETQAQAQSSYATKGLNQHNLLFNVASQDDLNANANIQQHDEDVREADYFEIELTDEDMERFQTSQIEVNQELRNYCPTEAAPIATSVDEVNGSSNTNHLPLVPTQDHFNIEANAPEHSAGQVRRASGGTVNDYSHDAAPQVSPGDRHGAASFRQSMQPPSLGVCEPDAVQSNEDAARHVRRGSQSGNIGTTRKPKHYATWDPEEDENAGAKRGLKRRQTLCNSQALGCEATRKPNPTQDQKARKSTNVRQRKPSAISRPSSQAPHPTDLPTAQLEVVDLTTPAKAESTSILNVTPADLKTLRSSS